MRWRAPDMTRGALLSAALLGLGLAVLPAAPAIAQAVPTVRVGVTVGDPVAWELDIVERNGLDRANGVDVEVVTLTGEDAAALGLLGGLVDAILTDFVWVSRQRAAGADVTFVPHSRAVGGVVVRRDAGIDAPPDLVGRTLGIAGGPADTDWLLLRAYYRERYDRDLADLVEERFAVSAALDALIRRGELPAMLDSWPVTARLEAAGMEPLIGFQDILPALGVAGDVPLLGWVFSERFAAENPVALQGLLAASVEARQRLATDDAQWQTVRPLMDARSNAAFTALRDAYRQTIVTEFGPETIAAAEAVFAIVASLTGEPPSLSPGTFWPGPGL